MRNWFLMWLLEHGFKVVKIIESHNRGEGEREREKEREKEREREREII